MVNYAMVYGIEHNPGSDIDILAAGNANYALILLQSILTDTAAVAAFVAVMSLCSNLVRGSHAGTMRIVAFALGGLLEVAVIASWAFNVAYIAYSNTEYDISSGSERRQFYRQLLRLSIMEVKAWWALAIFELIVALLAVGRAVFVLARGGGKSAAGSKAVSHYPSSFVVFFSERYNANCWFHSLLGWLLARRSCCWLAPPGALRTLPCRTILLQVLRTRATCMSFGGR